MNQILACTRTHKILPDDDRNQISKSILISSFSSEYEEMKFEYGNNVVGVYPASHEERQRSGNISHNMKAWVDMYLLSTSNVLLTTSVSTFGFVAAGIGGIQPWIVMLPRYLIEYESDLPEPACRRAVNVDPCLQYPPGFAFPDENETVVDHVTREDMLRIGVKLVSRSHYNRTT